MTNTLSCLAYLKTKCPAAQIRQNFSLLPNPHIVKLLTGLRTKTEILQGAEPLPLDLYGTMTKAHSHCDYALVTVALSLSRAAIRHQRASHPIVCRFRNVTIPP
jgi:hypothetical protein